MASANPELSEAAVAGLIGMHTRSLMEMVDRYKASDYGSANAIAAEAYAHMFDVGEALAAAIAAQLPTRFGDLKELPRTDTAPAPEHPPMGSSRPGGRWLAAR